MNGSAVQAATIGVIGDVHLFWDDEDVDYFNQSNYDLLLFVGDLAAYTQLRGRSVARSMAKLRIPAMCIPGNHDGLHAFQLGAEIAPRAHRLRDLFCTGQRRRCKSLSRALGDVKLVSYSQHELTLSGLSFNLVACRPHSIGGKRLACLRYLAREHEVDSMEASIALLKRLVDRCNDDPVVFLAHNGPLGLGDRADSIWGCDFRNKEEDWGDRDLRETVEYAKSSGRRVLAAVAGHMHRRTKSGKQRPPQIERDGTLYVNAAEVPRHRIRGGKMMRHHVRLTLTADGAQARDVWV